MVPYSQAPINDNDHDNDNDNAGEICGNGKEWTYRSPNVARQYSRERSESSSIK